MFMEARKLSFTIPEGFLERVMFATSTIPWVAPKIKQISLLLDLCKSPEEAELILHVIENFSYFDADKTSLALEAIKCHIVNEWKLSPEETCFVCKDIEGKTDSSAAIQQMIKTKFASEYIWKSNKNFKSNISNVIKDKEFNNVVIVDDFSGTGKSLEKLFSWFKEKRKEAKKENMRLYAAFLGSMEKQSSIMSRIEISGVYVFEDLRKLISDFFNEDDAKNKKNIMQKIAKNYGGISRRTSLGYDQSESGFAVQNLNTPNNVFPVIWKATQNRDPIFPRTEKK